MCQPRISLVPTHKGPRYQVITSINIFFIPRDNIQTSGVVFHGRLAEGIGRHGFKRGELPGMKVWWLPHHCHTRSSAHACTHWLWSSMEPCPYHPFHRTPGERHHHHHPGRHTCSTCSGELCTTTSKPNPHLMVCPWTHWHSGCHLKDLHELSRKVKVNPLGTPLPHASWRRLRTHLPWSVKDRRGDGLAWGRGGTKNATETRAGRRH
jgi:hypothetical protein